jgi:iron-sulfur cluster repair protein YtfE (RIC family)
MDMLGKRTALPDALRVLMQDYPREGWEGHRHFEGLVRFWLERHLMFRQMTALMQDETQAMLDKRMDSRAYTGRLAQIGSQFVQNLHGHHQIEDGHYFPILAKMDKRLQAGFDLLDSDHHALEGTLQAFVQSANAVLQKQNEAKAFHEAAGGFATQLARITTLLDRHLVDEEELGVPIILKHGPGRLG